jgi:hypothetical protein
LPPLLSTPRAKKPKLARADVTQGVDAAAEGAAKHHWTGASTQRFRVRTSTSRAEAANEQHGSSANEQHTSSSSPTHAGTARASEVATEDECAGVPSPMHREAERVLQANGELGSSERWLVKWRGQSASQASWLCRRSIPPALLCAYEETLQAAFNRQVEPMLTDANCRDHSDASGVKALSVRASDAAECAAFLLAEWTGGKLLLPGHAVCRGYASYGKTLSTHDAEQQRTHTLLITNPLLPFVRAHVPGFLAMETYLVSWLQSTYGTVVEVHPPLSLAHPRCVPTLRALPSLATFRSPRALVD